MVELLTKTRTGACVDGVWNGQCSGRGSTTIEIPCNSDFSYFASLLQSFFISGGPESPQADASTCLRASAHMQMQMQALCIATF